MPLVFVVSDLHLGSSHFQCSAFNRFLADLPADSTLVVNGDMLDRPGHRLPDQHATVLEWLKQPPNGIRTLFVEGNHDSIEELAKYEVSAVERVEFRESSLLVTHGASFDSFVVGHKTFIKLFRAFHNFRVRLGAPPVHVARYAKQWRMFYRIMCRNIRREAVQCARSEGFSTVTCGHVHSSEDVVEDGVRYLNTGSWTEPDTMHYLRVNGQMIELRRWGNA